MKKILNALIVIGAFLLTVTGCTTSKSYTYNVNTGDTVKIELKTSSGYNIASDLPFTISKDDKTLSQGTFITADGYNQYLDVINNDPNSHILDSGSRGDITYTFYSYNNSEFNYVIKINGSNTGILLGNPNSQTEAQDCFNRLTFSLVN